MTNIHNRLHEVILEIQANHALKAFGIQVKDSAKKKGNRFDC